MRRANPSTSGNAVLDRSNFDRFLYPDTLSQIERQAFLEGRLRDRIEEARGNRKFTEAQQARLYLAGKGDIKHYFDTVEEERRQFEKDRMDFNQGVHRLMNLRPLRGEFKDGILHNGFLFSGFFLFG